MKLNEGIQNNQGTIVDVRSPGEFRGGSVAGAVNVPLNELPQRLQELKQMSSPLVLCCASGNRSGQAAEYLAQQGIACLNGGSWVEVNLLTAEEVVL